MMRAELLTSLKAESLLLGRKQGIADEGAPLFLRPGNGRGSAFSTRDRRYRRPLGRSVPTLSGQHVRFGSLQTGQVRANAAFGERREGATRLERPGLPASTT